MYVTATSVADPTQASSATVSLVPPFSPILVHSGGAAYTDTVLTNFDIVAAAGAALTAIDKTFPVTVSNNQITIQFTSGSVDLPKVSAIQIH